MHIENVAYDSIKQLIKDHTSPGKGQAVTIPGKGDSVDDTFEDQLFIVFAEQHDNVNLFVRSKSGEIDRRLGKSISNPMNKTVHLTIYLRRSFGSPIAQHSASELATVC